MSPDQIVSTLDAQASAYIQAFVAALPRLGLAALVLLLTWGVVLLAGVFLRGATHRFHFRRNLVDVLGMLTSVVIWTAGGLIALTIVFPTITPGKALTTLGLGSVAIGFAFKDTFENFLAGILILLREPFQITDHIACEGVEGQIEAITIRDTRIRQTDGQLVVMPNATLFQNPVVVRTSQGLRRTTVICGVAYDENVDEAREVIRRAVEAVDTVRDDVRDVQVFAQAFGASSIDFEVTWWTGSSPVDIRRSRDQVVAAVKAALDDAGIEIPFPYRTMTFKEPLVIVRQDDEGSDRKDSGRAAGGQTGEDEDAKHAAPAGSSREP